MSLEHEHHPPLVHRSMLGLGVVLVLGLPWMHFPGLYRPAFFRGTLAPILAWGIILLGLLRKPSPACLRSPANEKPRPYGLAGLSILMAFVGWTALSTCWSADALATACQVHVTLIMLLLAVAVSHVGLSDNGRCRVLPLLLVSGALSALAGVILTWAGVVRSYATGRYIYPFHQPAAFAGSLVFPAIVLALLFFRNVKKKPGARALLVLAGMLSCMGGVAAARTRTCIAGIAAGLVVGAFLMLPAWRKRIALSLLAITVLSAGAFWFGTDHTTKKEMLYAGTSGTRVLFGWAALRLTAEKPVHGWGAGTYAREAPLVADKTSFLHGQRGDYTESAHSEPLQILSETGLIGLGLWMLAHGLVLYGLRQRPILAAGLVGMMVDSVGSMSLRHYELCWFYALFLGYCSSQAGMKVPQWLGSPRFPSCQSLKKPVAVLVLLASAFHVHRVLIPEFQSQLRLGEAFAQDISQTPRQAITRTAFTMANTSNFMTWYRAAQLHAHASESTKAYADAIATRWQILSRAPGEAVNRRALATLLYRSGNWQDALTLVVQGLQINPYKPILDRELSRILRGMDLAQLAAWELTTFPEAETRQPALTASDRQYLICRLLWEAGNRGEAVQNLTNLDQQSVQIGVVDYYLIRWARQTGDSSSARGAALSIIQRYPIDPRLLALAADILSHDKEQAVVDQAYTCIRKAEALGRALPEVVEVAARLYTAAGWYDDVERITGGAVSQDKNNPRLWIIRIQALRRIGRHQKAALLAKEATRRFPQEPFMRTLLHNTK